MNSTLTFPDIDKLVDFIINEQPKGIEIDSRGLMLSGHLSENELITACSAYKAELVLYTDE